MSDSSPYMPPAGVTFSGKAFDNPAVACCCKAAHHAYCEVIDERGETYEAKWAGMAEYRRNMPPLTGLHNIRDFIACVAHGVLVNAIEEAAAGRLLYAAQVATTSLRLKKRPKNVVQEPFSPGNSPFANPEEPA